MEVSTNAGADSPRRDGDAARGGKYLTFRLGSGEYGLSLLRVREIIALMDVTAVPLMPPHVRGVMNLRGKVIPVIDLRRALGMEPTEDHDRKCIIVVDVRRHDPRGEQQVQMSVLVDAVSEVLRIAADEIEKPPALTGGIDADFIQGMAKAKGSVKILLDIDSVLARSINPTNPITTANVTVTDRPEGIP